MVLFGIWYELVCLCDFRTPASHPPALCDLQTAGHIFIICQSSDRKPSWCMCNEPGHTKLHLCLTKMPSSRDARCPLHAIVLLRISSPAAWAFGLYGHSWWPGVKAIVTDSPINPPPHPHPTTIKPSLSDLKIKANQLCTNVLGLILFLGLQLLFWAGS